MLCPSVCYTIFRYFDNNWNSVYPLQNFLDELFKLPSNSSNPLLPPPQKWPLISLSLSSFQIFQKYFSFFVLEPLLKPFRTNTQISFHRFSFPFTFLQFFFQIIPNYNCPTILNPVFAGKYSTPFNLFKLSQTPNLLPRMIKKGKRLEWKKGKKGKLSASILDNVARQSPSRFSRNYIAVAARIRRRLVSARCSIFFNARGRTRASAWSRTKRVWLL